MLFLAFRRANRVLGVLTVQVGSVAAHNAPAESSSVNSQLILDLDIRHVRFGKGDRVQRNLVDFFLKGDSFDVQIDLAARFVLTLTVVFVLDGLGVLVAFDDSQHSGFVKADVVDQVLHDTVHVLVKRCEGNIGCEFVDRNDGPSFD